MESRNELLQARFADFLERATQASTTLNLADSPSADLSGLTAEMAALKTEVKKEVRLQKDALGQFTALLDTLQGNNQKLSDTLQQQKADQQRAVAEAEKTLLSEIIELYDRLETTVGSLQAFMPPALERKKSQEFRTSLQEGLEITLRRTAQLLEQYQITAVEAVGRPVDPHSMRVTEIRNEPGKPDGQVLEEIRRGYLHQGQLFRLAEVAANRHTTST